jgi:spectinomycin phosphotransferase
MLDDGSADPLAPWRDITGRSVNESAIRFFGLIWTLSDLASFTVVLRSPHQRTRETDVAWNGFLSILGGEASRPVLWARED